MSKQKCEPKIYTQSELDAAVEDARPPLLGLAIVMSAMFFLGFAIAKILF